MFLVFCARPHCRAYVVTRSSREDEPTDIWNDHISTRSNHPRLTSATREKSLWKHEKCDVQRPMWSYCALKNALHYFVIQSVRPRLAIAVGSRAQGAGTIALNSLCWEQSMWRVTVKQPAISITGIYLIINKHATSECYDDHYSQWGNLVSSSLFHCIITVTSLLKQNKLFIIQIKHEIHMNSIIVQ